MIYEFENSEGHIIERDCPMSEAPPIGSEIEVDGVVYRRILPRIFGVSVPYNGVVVSERMDLNHPLAPRCDEIGRAVFLNRAEQDEFAKRTQDTNQPVVRA